MKTLFIFLIVFLVFIGCENSTGPPVDTTPPKVISTVPEKGAVNVPVSCDECSIRVEFSEEINPQTVNIVVETKEQPATSPTTPGTGAVTGAVVVDGKVALFKLSANLAYSTTYTATVKAGVRDKAGNAMKQDYVWSFTTEKEPVVPDTTPPQVVSTEPADGATGVPRNAQIKVVFSEAVNVPYYGAFSLKDENGKLIAGSRSVAGSTFTFIPSDSLQFSTTYTATITTAVTDKAGNHLPEDYTFSFTVKPDDVAPQVVETFPADGDTGIAKDTDIWVKFDEPIDPLTVNYSNFIVSGPNRQITGDYQVVGDTVKFLPDSLSWETTYTVTVGAVADLAGNIHTPEYVFSFTTQADTTPRWTLLNGGMKRLAITNDGIVYALGGSRTLNAPVVVKFNQEGKIVWITPLPDYVGYNRDIAVYSGNGQDEVYVLTAQYDPMGGAPSNITKLDGSGNIVWISPDFSASSFSVEVSDNGRVFSVASGILREFSSQDGSVVHTHTIGTNNTNIFGVVAFSDYIYISGETRDDLFAQHVNADWFVAKYDANYNLIWGVQFNGTDSVEEYKGKVAVDSDNNIVYVGGGYGVGMSWIKDGIAAYEDQGNSASFLWFNTVTNHTSAFADFYTNLVAYNGSVYYGNWVPNTPVKVLSDGTIDWNMTSDGVEDFVFYNGKMYVLFPYPRSNKIYIFDAETGVPLN